MKTLTKNLRCVLMRNGVEVWEEDELLKTLQAALLEGKVGFIQLGGKLLNAADITGIFTAKTMEELTRRKNGQWKCQYRKWHDRGGKCQCKLQEMSGEQLAKWAQGVG